MSVLSKDWAGAINKLKVFKKKLSKSMRVMKKGVILHIELIMTIKKTNIMQVYLQEETEGFVLLAVLNDKCVKRSVYTFDQDRLGDIDDVEIWYNDFKTVKDRFNNAGMPATVEITLDRVKQLTSYAEKNSVKGHVTSPVVHYSTNKYPNITSISKFEQVVDMCNRKYNH